MNAKQTDQQYSDEEASRRMEDALKRAFSTPPKHKLAKAEPQHREAPKAKQQRAEKTQKS
jgi:hypothetical protein